METTTANDLDTKIKKFCRVIAQSPNANGG